MCGRKLRDHNDYKWKGNFRKMVIHTEKMKIADKREITQ